MNQTQVSSRSNGGHPSSTEPAKYNNQFEVNAPAWTVPTCATSLESHVCAAGQGHVASTSPFLGAIAGNVQKAILTSITFNVLRTTAPPIDWPVGQRNLAAAA